MKRLVMCAVVLALLAMPAFAQQEEADVGRWDPSGTYIVIDEEGACVTAGSTLLVQMWPVDHARNHYLLIQDRQNNRVTPNHSDVLPARGDMWRTGRNSFKWSSIMYTLDETNEPNAVALNTGDLVRKPDGRLVAENFYWYAYYPWDNPLDPEAVPIAVFGPCEVTFNGKLEYVPPPEE
jgi:hypothetical protein